MLGARVALHNIQNSSVSLRDARPVGRSHACPCVCRFAQTGSKKLDSRPSLGLYCLTWLGSLTQAG